MKRFLLLVLGAFVFSTSYMGDTEGAEKLLKMSTTTSTENSGLLDILLPEF